MYSAQAGFGMLLSPPNWVIDSYKSITWSFIWKGKIEPVGRDRCYAPTSKGGLNIVNFLIKCISLRLSNFPSLRDSFGSEKWHYMARYFLSNRLVKYDNRFSFFSNNIATCSAPSLFYKKCLDKFNYLFSSYGNVLDDLSCKHIYKALLVLPSAVPGCAGFSGAVVGRPINQWASVWRKSRLKLIENKKNDLLWLILHRPVRVRYSLKKWGYIGNDKCAICSRVESIEHCFLECDRIVRVWKHFSTFLSRFLNSRFVISAPTVFYPLSDSISPYSSLSNFLLATILFWIWNCRNLATFRNSRLNSLQIIDLINNDVKSRIRCDAIDSVRSFWSLQSVFCSVNDNGHITFLL